MARLLFRGIAIAVVLLDARKWFGHPARVFPRLTCGLDKRGNNTMALNRAEQSWPEDFYYFVAQNWLLQCIPFRYPASGVGDPFAARPVATNTNQGRKAGDDHQGRSLKAYCFFPEVLLKSLRQTKSMSGQVCHIRDSSIVHNPDALQGPRSRRAPARTMELLVELAIQNN